MIDPIRILIAEDSEADAGLAERAVRKMLESCMFQRVETRESFLNALATYQPDLIISDYTMPNFDGMQALKLAQARAPSTPVIIWTGSINEDTAVECMKAGASNYVLKDNIKRLGPAVVHALEEKQVLVERELAEERLRESEERLRQALSAAGMGAWDFDTVENRFHWNERTYQLFGVKKEGFDHTYKSFLRLIHQDDRPIIQKKVEVALSTDFPCRVEARAAQADGSMRWLSINGQSYRNEQNGRVELRGIVFDITESKQAEERLRKLSRAVEQSPATIIITDLLGNIEYANPAFSRSSGYTFEEAVGQNPRMLKSGYTPREEYEAMWDAITSGRVWQGEFLNRRKDGAEYWESAILAPVFDDDGRITNFLAVKEDITERKHAELLFRESEKRYRTTLNNMMEGCQIIDYDWRYIYINEAAAQQGKHRPEEYLMRTMMELYPGIEDTRLFFVLERCMKDRKSERLENEFIYPDGTRGWFELGIQPVPEGLFILSLDITERKRAEEALRKSEEQYRLLFENAPIGILSATPEGRILEVNPAALQTLGSPSAEATKAINLLQFPPLIEAGIAKDFQGCAQSRLAVINECPYTTKWGKSIYIHYTLTPVPSQDGQTGMIQILLEDITERKTMLEALRQAEEKYRSIFENALEGIFQSLPEGRFITVNPAFARMLGYESPGELIETVTDIASQIYTETPRRTEFMRIMAEQGSVTAFEFQMKRKDGTIIWVTETVREVRDEAGSLLYYEGVAEDVTDRKQAEQELRESEERFMHLADNIEEVFWITDAESGREIYISPAVEKIWGISIEKLYAGRHIFLETVLPEDRSIVTESIEKQARGEKTEMEYRIKHPDGSVRWIWDRAFPVLDETGGVASVAGIAADITERKRAEQRIQDQVARLNALRTIDLVITSSFDLRLSLNSLLPHAIEQLQVDAADVLLFNPALLQVEYAAGIGFQPGGAGQSAYGLDHDLIGDIILRRQPRFVADLGDYSRKSGHIPFHEHENFTGYYGVPLIAKGHVKGILEVFSRSTLDLQPDWLDFLDSLAGQAAIAIDDSQLFDGLQRSNFELAVAYDATIEGWSRAMDLRDKETEGHTRRVTDLTLQLAGLLGISEAEKVHIRRGALLHDMGKLGVPDSILFKPDTLTGEEWKIMRRHPTYAYEMLSPIAYLRPALDIPHCHHEKWDGSGYPRGLKGDQIPLAARIFAVVDVWDALRSDRPYREAWPPKKVREFIRAEAGTHFDPRVVEAFLDMDVENFL